MTTSGNPGSKPALTEAQRLLRRLRVDQPVGPDDPIRVDLAAVRGGSAARSLANTILNAEPEYPTHQLLTGFPGAGKTSELLLLVRELEQGGKKAVYLDLDSFVSRTTVPEPADVFLAIGAALYDEKLGAGIFEEIAQRVRAFLYTKLRVAEVNLGGKVEGAAAGVPAEATVGLKLAVEAYPNRLAEIRQEVETRQDVSIGAVVQQMLRSLSERHGAGNVVLVVDSLEHAATLSAEPAKDVERLRNTFIADPTLRGCPVHMVYTVPPVLLPFTASAGDEYDNDLVMVPSVSLVNPDGEEDEAGVAAMVKLTRLRVGLELFAGGIEDARTAVRASGGHIRALIRILRALINTRDPSSARPIATGQLEKIIDRMASNTVRSLNQEHVDLLRGAIVRPVELTPREQERPLLFYLYREALLLRYMNGGSLDIAHPLALRVLDRELYERRLFPHGRQGA